MARDCENSRKENCPNILLTSPIPGPPNTRISSLDDPPLSLIGITLLFHQSAVHCYPSLEEMAAM
jgi:hypothetical protein